MTEIPKLGCQNKSELQESLLNWYAVNRRDFPWRNTSDPFEILLAEKLLQQTKVRSTVVSIYTKLLDLYPTIRALAMANVEDLRVIIKPLGLTYRAAEIKSMATEIIEIHKGQVPSNLKDLLALTGVGDYCARAVLSFAYYQRVPIVDTNIARFLHRLCGIEKPLPANPARKKYLRDLATQLLPESKSRDFNFAILDLCALVCKPQSPTCSQCPVRAFCAHNQKITP
jgi:A/G-specific adenine glycosylase